MNISEETDFSREIIGAAVEVQRVLGNGLLESAYAEAFAIELQQMNLAFEREVPIQARYKGKAIGVVYKADFIVEDEVIVELKAVDNVTDIHKSQLLTYLRLSGVRLGLLLNFHDFSVARSAKRLINNHQ
jgi:GxxExxY protein